MLCRMSRFRRRIASTGGPTPTRQRYAGGCNSTKKRRRPSAGWAIRSSRPLYRRAAILGLTGDLAGERAVYHRLVEWAGDEHTMWRGMALHVIAKLQYLEGDTEAGVASAKEAARLLVDGGDLDFAAEAEYILAGFYAAEERFELAAEALERVDDYHRQIGRPRSLKSCRSSPPRSPPVWATGDCSSPRLGAPLTKCPSSGIARDFFLRGELGHPSRSPGAPDAASCSLPGGSRSRRRPPSECSVPQGWQQGSRGCPRSTRRLACRRGCAE